LRAGPQLLDVPNDAECAFCDYLNGRRAYAIVVRGKQTATMVTREQRGQVHLLVVSVRHIPTILEVANDDAGALMVAVRNAAWAIAQLNVSDGVSVWQNNGVSAAQAVGHLHFHVAGTLPNGGTDYGDVPEISIAAANEIGMRVRPWLHNEDAP